MDRDSAISATILTGVLCLVVVVLFAIMGRVPEWCGWTAAAVVSWLFLYAKCSVGDT